ncbi:hypothetical protein D3C87_745450 [compost metagenome]
MKLFLLIFLVFSSNIFSAFGQNEVVRRPQFQTKTSLVYYYFWEENTDGSITDSKTYAPFSLNRVVLIDTLKSVRKCTLSDTSFMQQVLEIGRNYQTKKRFSKKIQGTKLVFNCVYPSEPQTVIYIKRNGKWRSFTGELVLNFYSFENKIFFQSSGRMIQLTSQPAVVVNNNTYRTVSYFLADNSGGERKNPAFQHVFAFTGDELSKQIIGKQKPKAQRYLVFVNGYRGPKYDKNESRNEVYMNDRTNYWFKIDDRFIRRLNPDTSFYLDGSFPVRTSNHHSKLGFGLSYIRSVNTRTSNKKYKRLNQVSNPKGFDYRYSRGVLAGKAFLNEIHNTPNSYLVKDTIDIVCHSMGYAYTLGLLETIRDHIVPGKLYLLAPENAAYRGLDWNTFEAVWQYGSNLGQKDSDPLCYQDGVAPQAAVWGIDAQRSNHVGRVCSPYNWPNKHFVHSHMVYSYDWIFDRIQEGQPGYIH